MLKRPENIPNMRVASIESKAASHTQLNYGISVPKKPGNTT